MIARFACCIFVSLTLILRHVLGRCDSNEIRLYGLRVEEKEIVGFDKKHSCQIPKGVHTVRFFGCGMNEVDAVIFTTETYSCPKEERNQTSDAFSVLGPFAIDRDMSRLETFTVEANFPENGYTYYVCLGNYQDQENRTIHYAHQKETGYMTLSTREKPQNHYLPIPVQVGVILFLLLLSAMFSGLNLGLMALDLTELKLIRKSGSPKERKYAEKIIPVRKTGNYLLCTLLFGNVIVNSAISILMDDLTGQGFLALIVSTLAIVILGEITPQSICSRYGLAVGARTIWITKFFMVLTFPLSFPVSRVLDLILGKEVGEVYTRERLLELIRLSQENQRGFDQEVAIVSGALQLSNKTVKDVMTHVRDIYMIPADAVLDTRMVSDIVGSGYTRIPVYAESRDDIVGLLNVKDLALLDPDDGITVKAVCAFYQHPTRFVFEDMPLNSLLEEFKGGHYHMAYVRRIVETSAGEGDNTYQIVGLVTLEDIIEEIIQSEILDETDVITDNRRRLRRKEVQLRDFSYFMQDSNAQISPQCAVATLQFLSTTIEPFSAKFIAEPILQKLIKQNAVQAMPVETDQGPKLLYEKGKPADYFVLILEGRVEVVMGDDSFVFEAGPFFAFGKQVMERLAHSLRQSPSMQEASMEARLKAAAFVPDFTVRVTEKVLYLLIRAKTYCEAHHIRKLTTLVRQGSDLDRIRAVLGTPSPRDGAFHTPRKSMDMDSVAAGGVVSMRLSPVDGVPKHSLAATDDTVPMLNGKDT